MKTILLATDGSPSAELATQEAIELSGATGWPLRILVVWRTPVLVGYGYAPVSAMPELASIEKEHAGEVASRAVAVAKAAGVAATSEIREGDACEQICEAAEETHTGLIVIGAHGWSGLKRAVFGSVSTRVMHEAPCGVLVVRSPAID